MAGGTKLSQPQWAIAYLRALGNLSPSQLTIDFVTGWCIHEGGGGVSVQGSTNSCNGNALNTCQLMPGSVGCTSGCVQSYLSVNDGIAANATATRNGLYPSLYNALVTNDNNALGMTVGHKMTSGIVHDLSIWVNGPHGNLNDTAYAQSILNAAKGQGGVSTSSSGTQTGVSTTSTPQTPPTGGTTDSPFLDWLLGTPTASWISNPIRIIKLIAGLLCIAIALYMLIAPEAEKVVQSVGPLLAA